MRNASEVFSTFGPRVWEGSFFSWPKDFCSQVRLQFVFCVAATIIDAAGTAIHLSRGARELNPVWIGLIDQVGAVSAMGVRLIVGLVLLAILCACWRKPLARLGFVVVLAAFIPLTLYHLFLFIYLPLAG